MLCCITLSFLNFILLLKCCKNFKNYYIRWNILQNTYVEKISNRNLKIPSWFDRAKPVNFNAENNIALRYLIFIGIMHNILELGSNCFKKIHQKRKIVKNKYLLELRFLFACQVSNTCMLL